MIADHLVYFADQTTAFAAIPQHTVTDPKTQVVSLNPSYALPVTVSVPDPNNPGSTIPMPGYYAWISLPAPDATLQSLPNNACRLIADRDAAKAGKPMSSWLLYRAPDLTDAVFAVATVSPVFAGSNYPFGGA
jgi:hypothetical protein